MTNILLVAGREFRQITSMRSFWQTLLILPVALAAGPLMQQFLSDDGPERVMIVDRSGEVAQTIEQRFSIDADRSLLQALSRYREFAADRGSAILTGRPSALISALLKISGTMQSVPQQDLRAASGELAAFYIFPPRAKQTIASLFSTHPPLEARIAALQRFEAQLQGTA